jgi:hypothetical protein
MKRNGLIAALILGTMLSACATTGTSVTSTSEGAKDLAKSQQWWCNAFATTCGCTVDGMKTTCSLVAACLNAGTCKA